LLRFSLRWNRVSIAQFAARFSSPLMREMLTLILPHHSFFSMLSLFAPLAWMHLGSCATPLGGSRHFTALLEQRYRQLGGRVHLNTAATKICFEGKRADSVLSANGQHFRAQRIISAADRYHTHVKLLEGRFFKGREHEYFSRHRPFPSLVQVSLGVKRTFAGEPHKVVVDFTQPLRMGAEVVEQMLVRICNHDASFAPAGKTALIVHLRTTDVDYWTTLRSNDRAAYKEEKLRIQHHVIQSLAQRFSGIEGQIEVSDCATPATYIRYNNLWQGSYQSWAPTPGFAGSTLPRTLQGVPNFFFTGQWLSPAGGLPRAIVLGRQLAQRICAHDGTAFIHRT
jgi:phytoene dehydrogenase-like protein